MQFNILDRNCQMPLMSRSVTTVTTVTPFIGIELSKLVAPGAVYLVGHADPTIEHHQLDIPIALGERVIHPHAVGDAL